MFDSVAIDYNQNRCNPKGILTIESKKKKRSKKENKNHSRVRCNGMIIIAQVLALFQGKNCLSALKIIEYCALFLSEFWIIFCSILVGRNRFPSIQPTMNAAFGRKNMK